MLNINEIPQEARDDIACLMGDSVGCSELLKDILEDYYKEPWEDGEFFFCDPEDVPDLFLKIYNELYLGGN